MSDQGTNFTKVCITNNMLYVRMCISKSEFADVLNEPQTIISVSVEPTTNYRTVVARMY